MGIKPPEPIGRFIVRLNEASVATRYPEEIGELWGAALDLLKEGLKSFVERDLKAQYQQRWFDEVKTSLLRAAL
jgi:hypothetical protein